MSWTWLDSDEPGLINTLFNSDWQLVGLNQIPANPWTCFGIVTNVFEELTFVTNGSSDNTTFFSNLTLTMYSEGVDHKSLYSAFSLYLVKILITMTLQNLIFCRLSVLFQCIYFYSNSIFHFSWILNFIPFDSVFYLSFISNWLLYNISFTNL